MLNIKRLLGLAGLFLMTTGQAGTGGCAPTPDAGPQRAAPATAPAATPGSDAAPALSTLLGAWQCMTRQQRYDEPMFTFRLDAGDRWTDLTFGPAHRKEAAYSYEARSGEIRLRSASGNDLYTLAHTPAKAGEKERLVERLPENELYRAQACYRYDGPLAE